jgi:hypothetical protein
MDKIITIKELALATEKYHHYNIADDGNVDSYNEYTSWEDFYDEWGEADTDYNFVYRWDIYEDEENTLFDMSIPIILHLKGKIIVNRIKSVTDSNVEDIIKYIKKYSLIE